MFDEPVEAAIFDMDGTLIDSETVYMAGMQDAAGILGLDLPISICHAMVGEPRHECNVLLQQQFGADFDL
jgi:beta-phosphoglucomutase